MSSFAFYSLAVVFALVCLILSLLILIQRGRGGGLSGAFGGAGGNTAFGSKTGDVLTWVTAVTFGVFILLSMGLVWAGNSYVAQVQAGNNVTGTAVGAEAEEEPEQQGLFGENSSLPNPPSVPEPAATQDDDGVPAVPDADVEVMDAELNAPAEVEE